jgi:hypothetical protein
MTVKYVHRRTSLFTKVFLRSVAFASSRRGSRVESVGLWLLCGGSDMAGCTRLG